MQHAAGRGSGQESCMRAPSTTGPAGPTALDDLPTIVAKDLCRNV